MFEKFKERWHRAKSEIEVQDHNAAVDIVKAEKKMRLKAEALRVAEDKANLMAKWGVRCK